MTRRCTLRFRTGPLAGRTYSLGPGDCVFIGSGPSCAIRIPDDPTVSDVHACIYYEEKSGRIRFKDMGSEHGTLRNGRKLTSSTVIKAGDRVTLGRLSTFHSSWWNALQATRVTRISALLTNAMTRPLPKGDKAKKSSSRSLALAPFLKVAAPIGALVLAALGFAYWQGVFESSNVPIPRKVLAAKSGGDQIDRPRKKLTRELVQRRRTTSSLSADQRFIWDEIVSISRRFGEVPPTAMDPAFVREVERNIQQFTTRGRHQIVLQRRERYWRMITKILSERGLPRDLGYIVWVESGFDPKAVSPAGAAGLWQFMPETGKEYGLIVTEDRDDRFDPRKSTIAATAYISAILRMFGSQRYLLALASYNTGQYRVLRHQLEATVVGAKRADFWQIRDALPEETALYVPRIMAAMIIGRNLKRWESPVAH